MQEVHKFGGTSVGSPKALQNVQDIVSARAKELQRGDNDQQARLCVVVSAMGKTTDRLVELAGLAQAGEDWVAILQTLRSFHMDIVEKSVPSQYLEVAKEDVTSFFTEMETLLHGVVVLSEASDRTRARLMSFGERISSCLVAYMLKPLWGGSVEVLDARELIATDMNYLDAKVKEVETADNIQKHFQDPAVASTLYVIPGFMGGCGEETTLLGRGGSDYSASIFGAALDVDEVVIWTDVPGVKTADPRQVTSAQPVENLSFEEAMEISFFGAKIIYGPTMGPARKACIQMRVKSTFDPTAPGTLISAGTTTEGLSMRCVTSLSRVAIVNVQGCGKLGVTAVCARLFGALWQQKINVIFISQASSEHSICLCVAREQAESTQTCLEEEFSRDIAEGRVDSVQLMENHSIIAVVGSGISQAPGVLGKVATALGDANINIACLAQGSSERNISAVVKHEDEKAALNAIHNAFWH